MIRRMKEQHTQGLPLGQPSDYSSTYAPALLCPVQRAHPWREKGYDAVPYSGLDLWNAYELSWLNERGLPQVALASFEVPAASPKLIESKSFKLYLNSFAQSRFASSAAVLALLKADLSACAGAEVQLELRPLDAPSFTIGSFTGLCLDALDVATSVYSPNPDFLCNRSQALVEECLFTHLLRSLCPVTGQPDWGSISIDYAGPAIDHANLLRYLVSYREHSDFHEQCVERIYLDILERCRPQALTVYARYVRRGGLDINPFRTNTDKMPENIRLIRQ